MELSNAEQTGILEAVAVVGLIIRNEGDAGAETMVSETDNPVGLARAACGLAAALLLGLAPEREQWFLDQYRQHALGRPAGGS
ncbi:hypothetical protein [Arthrobacter burdickii]|uniref:Uncharacterized protein n=1 Tax=Arthrobacter burdickii TaxID=3035920 RepID=A0ABT8K150_9MICC|nr:hypothetical protein [Arthrobacter burdickii]MDN4611074.1 hypothetical protein [Arthrobacter burdickii]